MPLFSYYVTGYKVTRSCQSESRIHKKSSKMAKESSSEGEFLKKKSVDYNRKRIENLSKANAVKLKVIHLDQLEFLSIFPYSELLIWMLHQLTDHSYFKSVYLKIFKLFLFWQTKDFCLLPMYCRLKDFFMLKKFSDLQHMDLPRTGSYMGSADT